jgi:nucleoid DNA-binding protein
MRKSSPHINLYQLSRRCEVREQVVRDIFDVITACMEEGVEVRIREFGTFIPQIKAPRLVKSPLVEGGQQMVGERRVIAFRLSPTLKKQWTKALPASEE